MPRLNSQLRREQLLEHALPLFASGGYRGTTTARIVEAAGVSPPILYRHFSNKQELFAALLEHAAGQVLESWRGAARGQHTPAQRLDAVAAVAGAGAPAMKVLLRALGEREGDAAADAALRRALERLHRFLVGELRLASAPAWTLLESWTGRALLGPLR